MFTDAIIMVVKFWKVMNYVAMMENELEILDRVKKYATTVALPYIKEGKCKLYKLEEIQEETLSGKEKRYILCGWRVTFYNEAYSSEFLYTDGDVDDSDMDNSWGTDCFIALFKNGDIGFFRKDEDQWLEEAIYHFNATDYERAVLACEQVLNINPNNIRAYHGKGRSLFRLGLLEQALAVYKRILLLIPDSAKIYYEIGNVLQALEHYNEAFNAYDQALRLNPLYDKVYLEKGDIYFSVYEDYNNAFINYKQSVLLNPNNVTWYKRRLSDLEYLGYFVEALNVCIQVISLFPNDADLYYHKGLALLEAEEFQEAQAALNKSVLINPTSEAYYALGDVLVNLGYCEDAVIAYQQYLTLKGPHNYDDKGVYEKLGNLYYGLGRYEEALTSFNNVFALNGKSHFAMGCVLFHFHRYEEALEALRKSINFNVNNADAWHMKGDILELLHRPDASSMHHKVAELVASWDKSVSELEREIVLLARKYERNMI